MTVLPCAVEECHHTTQVYRERDECMMSYNPIQMTHVCMFASLLFFMLTWQQRGGEWEWCFLLMIASLFLSPFSLVSIFPLALYRHSTTLHSRESVRESERRREQSVKRMHAESDEPIHRDLERKDATIWQCFHVQWRNASCLSFSLLSLYASFLISWTSCRTLHISASLTFVDQQTTQTNNPACIHMMIHSPISSRTCVMSLAQERERESDRVSVFCLSVRSSDCWCGMSNDDDDVSIHLLINDQVTTDKQWQQ